MAKKYHPDKNGDSADSKRIIQIINESHEILCDPVRREKYDKWIADKKRKQQEVNARRSPPPKQPTPQQTVFNTNKAEGYVSATAKSAFWFGMAILLLICEFHAAISTNLMTLCKATGKCYASIGIIFGYFTFFFVFPVGFVIFNIY